MAWAVGQDVGNPLRKLVLMILADEHREDTDLCFPGLERIAAIGEMSTKSAARHIEALAEMGKIAVYQRGRAHGYTLRCPAKGDRESSGAPTTPDSLSTTPDSLSTTADSVSETPDRESTEPGLSDSIRDRAGGRARKRATRLPADWQPSEADIEFAREEGLDHESIERAADRFRDHWLAQPGAKGRKLDWPATWRNWARKDADDARRRAQGASTHGGRNASTQADRQRAMANGIRRAVDRRRGAPPGSDGRDGRGNDPPALAPATVIDA